MGDLIMENSKIEEAKQRLVLAMKNNQQTAKNYELAKAELKDAQRELWILVEEEDQ
jgi:hypothetical protein